MYKIETIANSPESTIRSHAFPVLEPGNISFPDGRYIVSFPSEQNEASFEIIHEIEGAPLISRLLDESRAKCACAVSAPISSYREVSVGESSSQIVRWEPSDLGEPPLFAPMVVSTESYEVELDRERDGVHDVWHGHKIEIPKGARLVRGNIFHLRSSLLQIIDYVRDEDQSPGTFRVESSQEEGFRFIVRMHPDLHAYIKAHPRDDFTHNTNVHVVTTAFALLQKDYSDDNDEEDGGWRSHRNLILLSKLLESKGVPLWDNDEFYPERALDLYPLKLPVPESEGE